MMIKVTKKNLEEYYNKPNGNLYYLENNKWQVVADFTIEDCKTAMQNGIEFAWHKGKELDNLYKEI